MSSSAHNFSGALATWKDINLSELQKTLDAQGVELVDNQKESVVGRKSLAEKTKEFKRIPEAERLAAIKGLLKAYQTEIDNLTKRSKFSENAYLSVYKVLSEAPDPYPLLEAAVDQTIKVAEVDELRLEVQRAREENADLKRQLSESASLESGKRLAEEKTQQLEEKVEEIVQEKVTQKENELHATYDERFQNYEAREQDLQRQVSLFKKQLVDLRSSNDSTEEKLLNQSSRQDQELVAKLAEMDFVVADLERANSRVSTVERRNESLRAEIESMRTGNESSDRVQTLEAQIADLESEAERASKALELQKAFVIDIQSSSSKRVEELSRTLQTQAAEVDQLRRRLKQYSDYDEVKRELEIIKYVEFAGLEDGDEQDTDSELHLPDPNAEKANAHHGKSLEALLATKNRRILEELTKFRVLHGELEASLSAATEQLDSTNVELEKQKALNDKLEADLLTMDKHHVNGHAPSPSESSDMLANLDIGRKETSTRSTPIPFTSSADTSILPIVTSQRDRFRQRNAELEEELRKQFQIISDLRGEVKTLQADNLKLYEKVRYMQSYREDAGSRPVTTQLDRLPAPADDMGKYRARYEESMNPFEAFRGREVTRAYESLNRIERGVLIVTRAVLSNRRTRTFMIIYMATLHLLVMYSTYELTTSSGSQLQAQPFPH